MSALLVGLAPYVIFCLVAGFIFVVIRLVVGPGQYGAIVEGLTGASFIIPLCAWYLVFMVGKSGPASWYEAGLAIVALLMLVLGLWIVWLSLYALWFAKRPQVEVDGEGVRFKSAYFTLIPWADIAGVGTRVFMWQEVGPILFLAEGRRVRTVYWPLPTRRLGLAVQDNPLLAHEIADLIRSHPSYRGKAISA